jgi:hemerythrin-like metal-binding protein
MPILHWQERYATGIQIIDDQHRQLIQTLNELFDLLQSSAPLDQISQNLECLMACAANHFQTEESVMEENGYPDISRHLEEHRILTRKIQEFRAHFSSPEPPTTLELSRLVGDWMSHHLGEVDMGYAEFLKRKQGV